MKHQNTSITKRILITLFGSSLSLSAGSKILIDFGNTDSFRGVSVTNPDPNGNHWNSVRAGAFFTDLVNTTGAASTVDFGFDGSGGPVGTDSFNGPAGATSDPPTFAEISAVNIDAAALGDLGISEAAIDFVSSPGGRFQIQGLSPVRRYQISFFGSAKFKTDSTTEYRIYDDAAYSNQLASGTLDIQNPASTFQHNRDQVVILGANGELTPSSNGILYVEFEGTDENAGILNALAIEDAPNPVPGDSAVLLDFGSASSFRGVSVTNPDANGNTWNSVAPGTLWENLNNAQGIATNIDVGLTTSVGIDSFNGPAGATSDPVTAGEIAATDIDENVLGIFGIKEAAIDFIATPNPGELFGIDIFDLDPTKKYQLHFFASRKFPSNSRTLIEAFDDSLQTNLLGETSIITGINDNHNASVIVALDNLQPSVDGTLYVQFSGQGGTGTANLNAMAITAVDPLENSPPVITLNGDDPLEHPWGSTFSDPSASAIDDVDGSVFVLATGSVDPLTPGTYLIEYEARDAAGNIARTSRTVNVVIPQDADQVDRDGISLMEKYAYGANSPNDPVEIPSMMIVGDNLVLTAVVRTDDPTLTILGETSTDLLNWTPLLSNPTGLATPDQTGVPAGAERREFTLPIELARAFLRLSIEFP